MGAINFEQWYRLDDKDKLDVLREEVLGVKRLVQYGVGLAGIFGAAFGSVITVLVQHYLK